MADPKIRNKRSSVPGKVPTTNDLQFGEFGINTYDGKVFISASNTVVGVGTTIVAVNPWNVGVGSTSYNTYFTQGNVGIGTTNPTSRLTVFDDVRVTGVVTASSFSGNASSATYATSSGIATYATSSGIATYATTAGIATYATTSGIATYATTSGISTSVIGGIGSITQLQVTGITTTGTLQVGTGGTIITTTGIGSVGIGTTNPLDRLTIFGRVQIQQDNSSTNRLILRGQSGSSYRWNIDNFGSNNDFRIFREDDITSANGSVAVSISTTGTVTATKFSGDGSLLTGITAAGSGVAVQNQGSPVGTAGTLNFSTNLTASFSSGTATISLSNNPSITGILTADQIYTSNNGNGQNVRIGDDAWFGDINLANTIRLSGAQNSDRGFIVFGNSDSVALGRTGSGPLYYGGNFTVAGIVTASSFSGNASSATYSTSSGIATYATTSGISTYATTSGIATYATSAGIATYSNTSGIATYATTAGVATALQNSRTFEITGDIIASPISFNGTGNVSLAATIQPNSVALGTDTTGDYIQSISGTANQITVTGGTGEGSTPTLSIPNQFTIPQDATVTRDLQVNRNLNVNGNITIGGSSATLFTTEFKVFDPDIVLGFRTDGSGNDVSTDNTANHGGLAIASTEGTPLIQLFNSGIGETNPATYKKIMWFKTGSFTGLGTDAWLINYAVGIGSTQFPSGTRLAAGSVQFTENDLAVIGNINASGIITASSFSGNASSATYATTSGVSTNVIGGIGSIAQLQVTGISTFSDGPVFIGSATSTGISTQRLQVTGGAYVSNNLGVGTANPSDRITIYSATDDSNFAAIGLYQVSNTFSSSVRQFRARPNGAAVQIEDNIGNNVWRGWSGTSYVSSARIGVIVDDTVTSTSVPGRFIFETTSPGGTSLTEKMRLTSSGNLGIGTTNPSNLFQASLVGITSDGKFLVGTSTSRVVGANEKPVQIESIGTTGNLAGISLTRNNTTPGNFPIFTFLKTRGSTFGALDAVQQEDGLSSIISYGSDGLTSNISATVILSTVDGTVSSGIVPGRLDLRTRNASGVLDTRLTIKGSGNVGIGTTLPTTALQIRGVLGFGAENNITIGSTTTGCSITSGTNNFFAGNGAGSSNTSGSNNNFIGLGAGISNTTGSNNNFFGASVGSANTTGCNNNFFGFNAGRYNTTGSYNNFFGNCAGNYNTTGIFNNFFGRTSGFYNTTGCHNIFFGVNSGYNNSTGTDNIFFGQSAGSNNTVGSCNIVIGPNRTSTPVLNGDNQLVIGAGSTDWIIGNSSYNVGIGTTNPQAKLHIIGGTTAARTAPLEISRGSLLSVIESDTFEYDGTNLYHTNNDTTNGFGRAVIPEVQFRRLTRNNTVGTAASTIFGAGIGSFSVLANTFYEFESDYYVSKGVAGVITFTFNVSTGSFVTLSGTVSPLITGITGATGALVNGGATRGQTANNSTIATASLANATSYAGRIKATFIPTANAKFTLQLTAGGASGTATVLPDSYMKLVGYASTISAGNVA